MKSRDQCLSRIIFFFFNDTATTEIYTLSLHDALPISLSRAAGKSAGVIQRLVRERVPPRGADRVARYVAGMNHHEAMHKLGATRMSEQVDRPFRQTE